MNNFQYLKIPTRCYAWFFMIKNARYRNSPFISGVNFNSLDPEDCTEMAHP